MVNFEPEYVGASFIHIDEGIDTGEVIHQIAARVYEGDTPSSIGNRLILDVADECTKLIINFDKIVKMPQCKGIESKVYKKSDYTEDSVRILYENFKNGLIEKYIEHQKDPSFTGNLIVNPTISAND